LFPARNNNNKIIVGALIRICAGLLGGEFGRGQNAVNKPVNEAIDEAINAAVFIDLVGELGPHINKAAASAQMLGNEAINKVAESA
jgi:hypothetical protein